jgi:hypothetical protein
MGSGLRGLKAHTNAVKLTAAENPKGKPAQSEKLLPQIWFHKGASKTFSSHFAANTLMFLLAGTLTPRGLRLQIYAAVVYGCTLTCLTDPVLTSYTTVFRIQQH